MKINIMYLRSEFVKHILENILKFFILVWVRSDVSIGDFAPEKESKVDVDKPWADPDLDQNPNDNVSIFVFRRFCLECGEISTARVR